MALGREVVLASDFNHRLHGVHEASPSVNHEVVKYAFVKLVP